MEFIRVESGNFELIEKVYSILAAAGAYMLEKFDLTHWATPYGRDKIAEDTENKQVYLVKNENDFIATFTLSDKTIHVFEASPDVNAMYLSKFAVHPGVMKSGVGSACIKYIEELCRQTNKTKLRFDVYIKSEHAIKFYLKMGYKEVPSPSPIVLCMEKTL